MNRERRRNLKSTEYIHGRYRTVHPDTTAPHTRSEGVYIKSRDIPIYQMEKFILRGFEK